MYCLLYKYDNLKVIETINIFLLTYSMGEVDMFLMLNKSRFIFDKAIEFFIWFFIAHINQYYDITEKFVQRSKFAFLSGTKDAI